MSAILILAAVAALLVYLFANADNEYVFIKDRPKEWVPKRKSINYYAWRGPMFVEDFANGESSTSSTDEFAGSFTGGHAEVNAKDQNEGQFGDHQMENFAPHLENFAPQLENFGAFRGANNPKAEIVPTCGSCEIPKYNKNVKGAAECHRASQDSCRVPTMTSEDGWRHEYWNSQYKMEGPGKGPLGGPGNYAQVSNNNLDAPNNLKSAQMRSIMGDWFHPRDKVSPWCYAENYKQCMQEIN